MKFVQTFLAIALLTGVCQAAEKSSVGIVNFADCVMESKYGKQEQEAFESLKTQMTSLVQDTEAQITDIANKFNDPDYLDGLSPDAEQELKAKYQSLSEEMNRYQNQYMQIMNQANMKMIQTMASHVNQAAEKISREKKFTLILNKDAAFYYDQALDITDLIVAEMDKDYQMSGPKVTAQGE